jgi:hypothetical protein
VVRLNRRIPMPIVDYGDTAIIHKLQFNLKISLNNLLMNILKYAVPALLFFLINFTVVQAQVITSSQIDSLAELTLKTFDVAGIAVAVVKDGKIIHAKGYGVRSLNAMKR